MSNDTTKIIPAAINSSLNSTNNTIISTTNVTNTASGSAVSSMVLEQPAPEYTITPGLNGSNNNTSSSSTRTTITEKPSKTGSDECSKESPTPKFGSRRNSNCNSSNSKTRHCTSLPIFHNAENSELCEIGSRPGMECIPLRTPPGQYHHYHHVADQTKSLQELQNEVGALLEFRDLVIETFPDLKHKMASMSTTNTLTGMASSSSLVSRREWEPGIRVKRKITQKENSDVVSSSLIRSRSNSHSGKKEPKSGEGNGSVVQDSGFSTETSSSKEAHSASSTTGAMQGNVASNRISTDADDELLNLLDVIHRKSNRLRDEVEYLQNIERDKLRKNTSSSTNSSSDNCLQKAFQEHVDKLNREDIQLLRRERDRLLDKLAEMEAETLAGRIKATKMQDQYEELCNVKKELEEQLKLALSQKLELNTRLHELQRQYSSSKSSSSSQSESTSHRHSSTTTILLEPAAQQTHLQGASSTSSPIITNQLISNRLTAITNSAGNTTTFTPVVVESSSSSTSKTTTIPIAAVPSSYLDDNKILNPFHSDSQEQNRDELVKNLGRLDGLISSPNRGTKVRVTDSKKIAAILLETNVLELQRHLLTLTVQNQVLTQRLEQATKSKIFLLKRLDKSKEELDDIRFQLEEKDIELEGTKAQLRVLESKTPLKPDFNTAETNRSSSTIILSSRDSLITSTQISTPSMKAMIPLPMEEIQQHSSSTESAQDQTERDSKYCGSGPETPKRRPSKIPLPGTKGYLAPKPPTGRSPSSVQKSPSGPVSNKSLSRSTGSLYGKSGPPSMKRSDLQTTSSLNRPDSAQSNIKDNSLGLNSSRSSSSSIPISSKSTPSPHKMISNSPLPKPKRDSLTSRVRHLDSLSRIHNLSSSTTTVATINNSNTMATLSSPSTPSSPSSPPTNCYNNYSSNNVNINSSTNNNNNKNNNINYNNNGTTMATTTTNNSSSTSSNLLRSTSNSKKDLSSSFTQGQLRDRDRKQSAVSVRRVSSASIGRGPNVDLQQQQNETESGKINKIRKFESINSLFHDFSVNGQQQKLECQKRNEQQKKQRHQQQQQLFTSRNLINKYIAKTYAPPAILKPSFLPLYHDSCDEAQIELAYKHPQLLFDLEINDEEDPILVRTTALAVENSLGESEKEDQLEDEDDDDDNNDDGYNDDESEKDLNSNSSTATTGTTNTTTTNYQTNKGIEIKYFRHSHDKINMEKKFLRRTVSATNFHVRNVHNQNNLNPVRIKHHQYHQHSQVIEQQEMISNGHDKDSPCKLIGKVNPTIARTWEQLNAFNNGNRNLSRSVSNMSDDSEKLFFCHPAVQESKSNFHVNKVIYSEEENSDNSTETENEEENNNESDVEGIAEEEDEDDADNDDGPDENSANFYDSIDDDFHRNISANIINNSNHNHSQFYGNIHSIDQEDDAGGEEMAEIDSFERKKCFWSLDSDFK